MAVIVKKGMFDVVRCCGLRDLPAGLRQLGAVSASQAEAAAVANAAWLDDVVGHLLAVLALDRFADYVSDQVVVPVRETAAQALAAVLQGASLCSLQRVLQLLACMYTHHEWHVRHGAYTGIKYLLASRWVPAGGGRSCRVAGAGWHACAE